MTFLRARFPNVHYSASVRDFGVTLDPVLSFSGHVICISRTCLYHLHQICTIRHAANTHVHALICTRVDFGNSIYAGLSSLNFSKLQSILNASTHSYRWSPEVSSHICLHSGSSPLASCAPAHSVQNSNTYVPLSARGSSFIPSDLMYLGLYTPRSLRSLLGCQRPSRCPSHAWCNCSI